MEEHVPVITAQRLDLVAMTPPFLEASLAGAHASAEALLGLRIPRDWLSETALIDLRLNELRRDPGLQPWLLRAISLRHERRMIGHIGFHTRPGPNYLDQLAPGGVEFGYTVYPAFRRQGYAIEAAQALIGWAHREHGIARFVVSISPDNLPSLGLAHKLGFKRIGSHVDEEDGSEDIFELRLDV